VLDAALASVSFRPVRIREIGGESVVLDGGVGIGDKVVALGGRFLHEGQRVRVDGVPDAAIPVAGNRTSNRDPIQAASR
jgi:hypothetical protein